MEPPNRIAVVHRIERRHLIDPHRRYLQYPSHLVHHTNAREAVLALAEIEQGHNGGFLVLGRVARENFFDELLILSIEFEGNAGVILGAVAVLKGVSTAERVWTVMRGRTTLRVPASLRGEMEIWKARRCWRRGARAALTALRTAHGAILEAIGLRSEESVRNG